MGNKTFLDQLKKCVKARTQRSREEIEYDFEHSVCGHTDLKQVLEVLLDIRESLRR